MRTLPIPPAQPRRRGASAKKPPAPRATKPPPAERAEDTTRVLERPGRSRLDVGEVLEGGASAAADAGENRRYVAMVSEVPGVEVHAVPDAAEAAPPGEMEAHRYATDIPVAIVSALLAGSTFLPWYHGPKGFGINVSGWSSGTWGPVIFFLALGSVLFVALRRAGIAVSLPIEESLVHEGAGWISLVGGVLKSRLRPGPQGLLGTSFGVWIAIGVAAVLIILAGRMSPHAPFVLRPGWARGRAGAFGIGVLVVVVAGSSVFATTNSASFRPRNDQDTFTGTVRGKLPECAKGFPLPSGLKPDFGFEAGASCQFQLTSTQTSAQVAKALKAALKAKRYSFTERTASPGSTVLSITKPRCASVGVVPGRTGSVVYVQFAAVCPTLTPRT